MEFEGPHYIMHITLRFLKRTEPTLLQFPRPLTGPYEYNASLKVIAFLFGTKENVTSVFRAVREGIPYII